MFNLIKISSKIFFIILFIFLLFDFLFGVYILEKFYWQDKEDFRVENDIYHHTIKKNYNGDAYFGGQKYKFCSDGSGFKSSCKNSGKIIKKFDIAIIGDSFTEGLGLRYDDTFVGIIANKLKEKKIANLAVSGYSPSIYYIKIKHLLEMNYSFKEVIIYIDINDIFNEAVSYQIVNEKVKSIDKKKEKVDYLDNDVEKKFSLKKIIKKKFRFTYENLHLLKMYLYRLQGKKIFSYVTDLNMAAWTYKNNLQGYGDLGVDGAIEKAKENITNLMDILDEKNIQYSIGVYPYPQTLFHDNVNSLQVKMWKQLCQKRCKNFYNNFPYFFKESSKIGPIETYYKYYIYRDVHFNSNGHKVIAENFLQNYENKK